MDILASDHCQLDLTPWGCWLLQCKKDNDDYYYYPCQVFYTPIAQKLNSRISTGKLGFESNL